MRVLQVVKTADGATWAAAQAAVLVRSGVEVHVALPHGQGRAIDAWKNAGAHLHIADLSLPVVRPHRLPDTLRETRRIVDQIQPDLIHSHFVTTTLTLRLALGKNHRIPRIYQVAGPLHLEHWHTRQADLRTAGEADYWVASSRCIERHYRNAGVPSGRLFLSYYGFRSTTGTQRDFLRSKLGLPTDARIVGNISYIYPPKYFLGSRTGLKGHEQLIDALAMVTERLDDVYGVLIGNTLPGYGVGYEDGLRKRAQKAGRGRILMPGYFSSTEVQQSWPDFQCAVHVPLSENCGGVVEPLSAGIPVIASDVGGLPEVIIDNITGKIVEGRSPKILAAAIMNVLSNKKYWENTAVEGRRLVATMFDINRTAGEVFSVYQHILTGAPRPAAFRSEQFVARSAELAAV
jgi:glycosyltransferase involved in cell wall biosynthesis